MRDPNFRRTVIFMAAHTAADGAFGYILNRPLDQRVSDLLPEQELGPLGQVPVFIGGPVATDKLAFASMHWNKKQGTLRCQTHLSVADALHELSMGHEVRGFVGYAGWSEGQLEGELRRRSWITSPARKAILTGDTSSELWSDILEGMGPLYMLMARTPENVHLN
jgi:putative transcriptional regulator